MGLIRKVFWSQKIKSSSRNWKEKFCFQKILGLQSLVFFFFFHTSVYFGRLFSPSSLEQLSISIQQKFYCHLSALKKIVLLTEHSFQITRSSFEWLHTMLVNGTLRHSFATLEGCNLLWHIKAPPPPFHSFCFSLSFFFF